MSQGSTVLPTTGVFSGLTEQGSINAALAALLSLNSGGSAPSAPTQYQFWADTSVAGQITVRQYIGTTWVPIWIADTGTGLITLASSSPQNWVAASGTHDAIAATYDPPVTALVDGMVLYFRATSANQTSAPTFAPNGLTAHPITKLGGASLWGGDIPGANAECAVRYNAANTRWELISPIFSVPVGGIVPYFGGSVPNGFALPQGQNLSSTTFPIAALVLGTTYGNPGGGNFTMPDLRGRFFFNLDTAATGGRISTGGGNFDGTVLGNTGGVQSRALSAGQIPQLSFTPSGTVTSTVNSSGGTASPNNTSGQANVVTGAGTSVFPATQYDAISVSSTFTGSAGTVGSISPGQVPMIPPSMGVNCMMRIG